MYLGKNGSIETLRIKTWMPCERASNVTEVTHLHNEAQYIEENIDSRNRFSTPDIVHHSYMGSVHTVWNLCLMKKAVNILEYEQKQFKNVAMPGYYSWKKMVNVYTVVWTDDELKHALGLVSGSQRGCLNPCKQLHFIRPKLSSHVPWFLQGLGLHLRPVSKWGLKPI